jgi:hypothetical protein
MPVKKLKPAKALKMPEYTPERIAAAKPRVVAAREHLASAQKQLDAACRDLCDVLGAADCFRAIASAADTVREVRYVLDGGVEAGAFAACGNITDDAKHKSCGGTKP